MVYFIKSVYDVHIKYNVDIYSKEHSNYNDQ